MAGDLNLGWIIIRLDVLEGIYVLEERGVVGLGNLGLNCFIFFF